MITHTRLEFHLLVGGKEEITLKMIVFSMLLKTVFLVLQCRIVVHVEQDLT